MLKCRESRIMWHVFPARIDSRNVECMMVEWCSGLVMQ